MRVVLDTNILARATPGSGGPARELFRRCSRPPHAIVLSSELLSELSRVLRYERLRRIHGLTDDEIDEHVSDVRDASVLVLPVDSQSENIVPGDPDDNSVIATAIVGQAEILCTRDRHFQHPDVQAYCAERGIRVMSDIELIELLREADAEDPE